MFLQVVHKFKIPGSGLLQASRFFYHDISEGWKSGASVL
jgi:hypothetical protein